MSTTAPPPGMDPAAAQRLLARGLQHHGAGELDAADALYREVLAALPQHPDALHLHGLVAHQRGRHQQAAELIGRALDSNPTNPHYLNNLGEARRGLRQFSEAIRCYRRALEVNSRDPNALNNLGIALHQSHEFDEAARAFDEALRASPGDPEVQVNLGNLHRDRGDLATAADCYRRAIESAPGFPPAHAWLGVTLYEMGQGDAAVRSLSHATELAPLDLESHNNLKRVRWNLDLRDQLHDSFIRACEQLPQVADTHFNLAESLILNGQAAEAGAPVERGLTLAPDSARGHSLLGRIHASAGHLDAAVEAHERALALDPDDPLLREEFANALLAAHDYQRTCEVLRPGLSSAPRRSGIIAHLTIALNEMDDPALASLVDYDRFVHARRIDVPDGFDSLEQFNAALHDELATQHITPNHALEQTMRGGTQTLNNLFQNAGGLVAVLERQLRKVIDAYVASLEPDPAHPFLRFINPDYVFTGAWSTILSGGGFDGSHIHNEGWLSGTYYVQVPPLTAQQHAAHDGYIQFGEPPRPFVSERNATRRTVRPEVGMAVLFPSYYWHGVRAFQGAGARHSVSYDII